MSLVCVTGATSGIGRATAGRFLREGWNVIAAGRRGERLDELTAAHPGKVYPLILDVRDRSAVTAAFSDLPAVFRDIDVLVNNAGLALGLDPAQTASLDDWDVMVDTNVKGLMYCARAVLPGMIARGWGHVVNIGSIAGSYAYPCGNVYGGTKAFSLQFSRGLRCDLHGTGVRVTDIEPGLLETEFSKIRFKGDETRADQLYAGTDPLRPEDMADIIWWVATQPKHVNITQVEVMPTSQTLGGTRVHYAG